MADMRPIGEHIQEAFGEVGVLSSVEEEVEAPEETEEEAAEEETENEEPEPSDAINRTKAVERREQLKLDTDWRNLLIKKMNCEMWHREKSLAEYLQSPFEFPTGMRIFSWGRNGRR